MKTTPKSIAVVLAIAFYHVSVYAQSSSGANVRNNAAWFLGWNGAGSVTTGSLEIQNQFGGENINFSTNDGTGTTQKATILANGNVGIGITAPAAVLHLQRITNTLVTTRYTNPNAVGINGNEGFEVGVEANGTGVLRHMNDLDIEVRMGNFRSAFFTHTNFYNAAGTQGTGLRICDPDANPGGDLDLWTSTSNQTHIVWGPNGRIFGRNNRFEIQADFTDGLWFNVVNSGTGTFFNQVGQETGRIGSNTFWRIGANTTNVNAARRLEVVDASNPQLRLTNNATGPVMTDFQTTAAGDLLINPFNSVTSRRVGINVTGTPFAKLYVNNNTDAIGNWTLTSTNPSVANLSIIGQARNASILNIGIIGQGGLITSPGTVIIDGDPVQLPLNVGVVGQAEGGRYNFGGIFHANSCQAPTAFNIGIYASATNCFEPGLPGYAGYFDGGIVTTLGGFDPSDINLKDSIVEYRGALSMIQKLLPKRYVFRNNDYPSMKLPIGQQIGFISQEIDTVLPQLVAHTIHPAIYDTSGTLLYDTVAYKALNYTGLIPIAIRGIQELKAITDSLGLHKAQVCSLPTDSNRLSKWSNTTGRLCSSLIYDDGTRVGISATHPDSKLYVENIDTSQKVIGIFGSAKGGEERNAGIEGRATGYVSEGFNVGVSGEADSSDMANAGVIGYVNYEAETPINVGVVGMAGSSENQNIGGYFEVDHKKTDYGIYAVNSGGGLAGYFDGDVEVTGSIYSSSDAALKQNVQNVAATDALAKLLQLQPRSYEFSDSNAVEINLPQGRQYGFLAQEVEQILPGLVTEVTHPQRLDNTGHPVGAKMDYKAINYTGLIPLLVSAVKDQQTKIDSLQQVIDTRLSAIEQRLNNCCERGALPTDGAFKDQPTTTVVELTNLQAIVLEQNVPNPFAEQTTINYFIPEGSGAAQVVFFDMLGRTIKTVDAKSGYGSLTVFASNLSTGQYSYALLIDGRQAASKSMIKTK